MGQTHSLWAGYVGVKVEVEGTLEIGSLLQILCLIIPEIPPLGNRFFLKVSLFINFLTETASKKELFCCHRDPLPPKN